MERIAGSFDGVGGRRIEWRCWIPGGAVQPRAHVIVIHGYGEHGERYARLAERLVTGGFAVWAPDHRGHGLSEGARGVVDRLDHAVADVDHVVELARGRQAGVPLFLFAHSMGGTIGLRYALDHPEKVAGLVLSAPAIGSGERRSSRAERAVLSIAARIAPSVPVHRLDLDRISRDPAERRRYFDDPLIDRKPMRARTVAEMLGAFDRFTAEVAGLRVPLLVLHGTADTLTSPGDSRALAEAAGSSDKRLILYDGFYHELINEPAADRERVMDDIVGWVRERTGDPAVQRE